MNAHRDSLPPPTKRQRQRQSCPRCCVSLSKSSSFYEHVSQCCPETSLIGPSKTENLSDSSFELDEGDLESTVFYDPPDCSSSGFTDHNESPNEIEHPLVDCTSTVSEEDFSCPPNFSDDSNTESESEGEPDSLTSEVS